MFGHGGKRLNNFTQLMKIDDPKINRSIEQFVEIDDLNINQSIDTMESFLLNNHMQQVTNNKKLLPEEHFHNSF